MNAREFAAHMALAMYLGEHCRFCDVQVTTMEELKTVVYAGYHARGRIAHQACWDAQPEETKARILAEQAESRRSAP
jgi:hypothetical protein